MNGAGTPVAAGLLVIALALFHAADSAAESMGGDALKPPQLQETDSVSQYGITWTFDKKVPVGRFVTGDYYVVGPVKVVSVTPAPTGAAKEFRNGSMLNPPVTRYSAYDGRVGSTFQQELAAKFPLDMKPGDSLVSSASLEKLQQNQVFPNTTRATETSPIRTAAILTCLAEPAPADAFRPAYCDLKKEKIHRAGRIHWELLPAVKRTGRAPELTKIERIFERPWIDHVYDWASREIHPSENMPGYGREIGRAVSIAGLLLCSDYTREEKAKLCHRFIQIGIDNWAIARRGKVKEAGGWPAAGGFGNGRKLPVVFAAIVLQDQEMMNIRKNAPETAFGEDQHTEFGDSWTGAKVRFTGQYPLIGDRQKDRGPYEHLPPAQWPGANPLMSEGYRRCCTSVCWVGQALVARMLHAEKIWDHDAFFAYVDRWMTQDDSKSIEEIRKAHPNFGEKVIRQGTTHFDPFVDEMWARYRNNLPPAQEAKAIPQT